MPACFQPHQPMLHSPHMVQISSLPTTGPVDQPLLQQQQQLPPQPPLMGMDPTTMMAHPPPLSGPGIVSDAPQVLGAGNPMHQPQPQQVVVTLSGTQTLPPSQMNGSLPGILPPPPPVQLDHLPPPPPPVAGQIQMNGSAMPHVTHLPHVNGVGPPMGQQHPVITSIPASMSLSTAAAGPLPTTTMNGALPQMNGGLQLQIHPHPPPQPQQGPVQQQQQQQVQSV